MVEKVKRIIRKLKSFPYVINGMAKVTFSQHGEDIIIQNLLDWLKLDSVTYLDIGANEPIRINNTYNLYLRGHRGVLIEPNAYLCERLRSKRPGDKVVNCGISNESASEADYYMFEGSNGVYNTFSKEAALLTEQEGIKIQKIIKVSLRDINDVISENFNNNAPTVISLDVEGLDEAILRKLDFDKHQPLIICVETTNFSLTAELIKINSILDLLASKGYFIYADTNLNTIFCSRKLFDMHLKKLSA